MRILPSQEIMKTDFYKYQAQTTPHPLAIEISHAKGCYIYDIKGKEYLDFIAGVSASSLGHCHPKVISAVKNQLDKYLHVMVYGAVSYTHLTLPTICSV